MIFSLHPDSWESKNKKNKNEAFSAKTLIALIFSKSKIGCLMSSRWIALKSFTKRMGDDPDTSQIFSCENELKKLRKWTFAPMNLISNIITYKISTVISLIRPLHLHSSLWYDFIWS